MKIIIATGGSGGHIFPALNVASELRNNGHEVYFAGVFGALREKVSKEGYSLTEFSAKGLYTESLKSILISCFSMVKSIWEAFKFLKKIKPDVVLGFGGYGAFPSVFAAALVRIPTIIHEQNVVPGRANALLAKIVKSIAVSFERSKRYFPPKKTILTGCPCRQAGNNYDKKDLLAEFSLAGDKFTILVLGGSQGSRRINSVFVETVPLLKKGVDIQIIHICGEADYEFLNEEYKKQDIPYCLYTFLDEIIKAYKVADLVVSRAGAGTVTEIAAFCLPAVFIPYPYAGGHQKQNALVLAETGTAQIVEEKDLSPDKLKEAIACFILEENSKDALAKKREIASRGIYHTDAASRLAELVTKL